MTSNVFGMVILSAAVALAMVIAIVVILVARMKRIRADQALVIQRPNAGPTVAFSPRLVAPLQTAEVIELGTRVVLVRETLPACDGTLLAVVARFELAIEPTEESVLRVAREMGVAKANDRREVEQRFAPHFAQVLRAVIAQVRPNELEAERLNVVAKVIAEASSDLGGFVVTNVVLTSVEPASERPELAVSLAKQLAEHGVMDVRFGSEVACDVPADAPGFSVPASWARASRRPCRRRIWRRSATPP